MQKKVMYVISSLNDGGAETIVRDYCLNIDRTKYIPEVLVVFDRIDTANARVLHDNNVSVIPIYSAWNIITRIFNKLLGKYYIPNRIKKIVRQRDVEILHVHQNFLHYISKGKNNLGNTKIFYTCHSVPYRYFSGNNSNEAAAAKSLLSMNNLALIGLHNQMVQELKEMFSTSSVYLIRNGIDYHRFAKAYGSKNEIRKSIGIPEESFVLGHVGRFYHIKNHMFLVEIFKKVCEIKKNAFLFLIGDGESKQEVIDKLIEYGLQNRYLILSNRSDIPFLLNAMDVFVFPSKLEGFPVSLIEAQAAGLRCVVSDTINKDSFLTRYVTPLDIKGSPDIWAEEIVKDIQVKYCPEDIAAIEQYDIVNVMKDLERLYQSL